MEQTLNSIRRIRNVFAHTVKPLDFTYDLIADEVDLLPNSKLSEVKIAKEILEKISPQRNRYVALCFSVAIVLEDHAKLNKNTPVKVDLSDGPSKPPVPLPRKSGE